MPNAIIKIEAQQPRSLPAIRFLRLSLRLWYKGAKALNLQQGRSLEFP